MQLIFLISQSKLDKQQDTLFYQIEIDEAMAITYPGLKMQSIAELFNIIESNKEKLMLETYSLSQTTLEQVFMSFAVKQKIESDGKKKKKD